MKLDNTQLLPGFLTSCGGKPFRGPPLDSLNLAVAVLVRRDSTVYSAQSVLLDLLLLSSLDAAE